VVPLASVGTVKGESIMAKTKAVVKSDGGRSPITDWAMSAWLKAPRGSATLGLHGMTISEISGFVAMIRQPSDNPNFLVALHIDGGDDKRRGALLSSEQCRELADFFYGIARAGDVLDTANAIGPTAA
jgi:hypothetical protein